jgi:hypothetical protein
VNVKPLACSLLSAALLGAALTGCTNGASDNDSRAGAEAQYEISQVRLMSESMIEVSWEICAPGGGMPDHELKQTSQAVAVSMSGPRSYLPESDQTCSSSVRIPLDSPLGQRDVVDGNTGESTTVRYR